MRKRTDHDQQIIARATARPRGVLGPVLGILMASASLAGAGGLGVAYILTPASPSPSMALRAGAPAPALLRPPIATPVVAEQQAPVLVPLPPTFAAALAEQRAEIDRLQQRLTELATKTGGAATSIGPPPLETPPTPRLASPLPAVDVAQRPEPKRPRETLFAPMPMAAPPAAPAIQRRAPVLAAQKGQTESARSRQMPAMQTARQEPARKPPAKPLSITRTADGGPHSYKFEDLDRIRVGDTIPDWGIVSAVSRDNDGGIRIRTESGVIRRDAP